MPSPPPPAQTISGECGPRPRRDRYDTWSTHYERDEPQWIDRDGDGAAQLIEVEGDQNRSGIYAAGASTAYDDDKRRRYYNEGANGFDDNGNGLVDEDAEKDAPPPYPHPLRGLQVKIRVFEPDSRQIREVTVVQEFLTK